MAVWVIIAAEPILHARRAHESDGVE
jgi:hypothetical protein